MVVTAGQILFDRFQIDLLIPGELRARLVQRNRIQPGAERSLAAKLVDFVDCFQERVLNNIFGVLLIAGQFLSLTVDFSLVGIDERLKRLEIPGLGPAD